MMRIKELSKRHLLVLGLGIVLVPILLFYTLYNPSNDRTWTTDQRVLAHATIDDNLVHVSDIRNFTHIVEGEYTPAYYDATFDVDTISSVDYILSPFWKYGAAHSFLSFGFENGTHLAISIEIRKEVGESFSPIRGLFRQFEIMYVVADERDVVNLRANIWKDKVYLYPLTISKADTQALFLDMIERTNALKAEAEFYNTITNSCVTNVIDHINAIPPYDIPWDITAVLPRDSDIFLREQGLIADDGDDVEAFRKKHHINDLAEQYVDRPDFSKMIRER